MTAKEKFSRGNRVYLSVTGAHLIRMHDDRQRNKARTGEVVGFSHRKKLIVLIRRDGTNYPVRYHMDHWDVDWAASVNAQDLTNMVPGPK